MKRSHLSRSIAAFLLAVSVFPTVACSRSETGLSAASSASASGFVSVDFGSVSVVSSVPLSVVPTSSSETSTASASVTATEITAKPTETTLVSVTTPESTTDATMTLIPQTLPISTDAQPTTASSTEPTTASSTEPTTASSTEPTTEPTTASSTEPTTEPTSPPVTTPPAETTKTPYSGDTNVIDLGNVIVIGNSAMEHYYGVDSVLQSYANTVSTFKANLPDVNVYAMFCPSAVEFCAPSKFQYGTRSQQRAMNVIYDALTNGAIGVDTWSELNNHAGEYLYFRTDHHWTQRGAYYAYRAFCKAAGFTPHEMSEYETGKVENFVGTMSIYAKDYASRFYDNPDYVEFFRPLNSARMTVYSSPSMTNGTGGYVMYSKEYTDKLNRAYKYSMFTGGDHPLAMIVSDTVKNGRTLLITKESYGNALIPFLTDHFEVIYVVDPREFNTNGKPNFNLVSFAQSHGVTDLICCNAAVLLPGINSYLKKMY